MEPTYVTDTSESCVCSQTEELFFTTRNGHHENVLKAQDPHFFKHILCILYYIFSVRGLVEDTHDALKGK